MQIQHKHRNKKVTVILISPQAESTNRFNKTVADPGFDLEGAVNNYFFRILFSY